MTHLFLIPFLLLSSSGWTQPNSKSLQTTRSEKTNDGINILVKPIAGHHFNLEAPNRVKKNGKDLSTLNITPMILSIPIKSKELSEKCELQIQTYVCDDKKTFCSPQNSTLNCTDLQSVKTNVTVSEPKTDYKSSKQMDLFIVNDPKMAIEKARKTGKPLFIDFYGTWCPPCNMLDETVFNDPLFQSQAKDFVLLKLDADDKISWDLKSKYGVKGYPTVVLATSTNEEITRFVGAVSLPQIIKLMKHAIKNKHTSLAQKREQYRKNPNSKQALEIIDSLISSEDFASAMSYVPEAFKSKSLSVYEKEILLLIPILALSKDMSELTIKTYLPLVKSLFENFPVSDLYFQKLEVIQEMAKMSKDDDLTKWIHEMNLKNIQLALAQPKLKLNNISRIDLMTLRSDSYEKLGQTENEKKSYSEIASEYDKLIVQHKQNPQTNRGYNLERIYSLYKSGAITEARKEYEKLIDVYPNEFTFHYNYASVLKDLKDWDKALEVAQKALQYSYGDNQLRAIYLVSEIESKKGLRKDSIDRLTKAIESTELPKDETVRTHRYVKRLVELKKKIQDDKTIN